MEKRNQAIGLNRQGLVALLLFFIFSAPLAHSCNTPSNTHKRAFAYTLDEDTVAAFFLKEIEETTISSVLITLVEDGVDIFGAYALLQDIDYGIEGVDTEKYTGTIVHFTQSSEVSVMLWAAYSSPLPEGGALTLCSGPSYTYELSDILVKQ